MAIHVKPVARKNPQDMTAAPKFYAQVVNQGEIVLKDLSVDIARMSTVSRTDVYAVLMSLIELVPAEIGKGHIVRLGELGDFSITARSTPALTAEEFTANNVTSLHLQFRPSVEVKKAIKSFTITKVNAPVEEEPVA